MAGKILRHPEELHNTILEGFIKGKIPPGRPRNAFIGQIKKKAGLGNYRVLKGMVRNREKWRRIVANLPTG